MLTYSVTYGNIRHVKRKDVKTDRQTTDLVLILKSQHQRLNKKQFWLFNDEPNATYKLAKNFMVTFNGYMVIENGAYEIYDATKNINVLVPEHGVVNIEKNKGDWQMYRH